jgi:hypothetical protein
VCCLWLKTKDEVVLIHARKIAEEGNEVLTCTMLGGSSPLGGLAHDVPCSFSSSATYAHIHL